MLDSEFQDLKNKVSHLEYDEINQIKDDINNIKIDLNTNNLLTKQSIESSVKLTDCMETVKITMVELAQSVKDGNRVTSELADTVKGLNDKVQNVENKVDDKFSELDEKINNIDDKGKIDIIDVIKSNWIPIVMGIGIATYFITQL